MQHIEKTVFLSYRRTNFPWALNIYQDLTHHGYDVFFDYTGLGSGDFEPMILENIKARAHFLVLLTPSALENCDDPADWLRREIETALINKRNIVPLMLEGFQFGSPRIASQLTGSLAALKQYHALSIPPEYFMEAMQKLRNRFLNVPLASVLHPASLPAQRAAAEQQIAAAAARVFPKEELTAQQWAERGLAAFEIDERLHFYSEAIRLKPDYAAAFYSRGNAHRAKGDLEAALQDYNEAIRCNPDYAEAFNNRGNTLRATGDLEGALQDYNEAIQLKPNNVTAFNNRGAVRHAMGDLEGALQDYTEAIRIKPDLVAAFYNRGNVYLELGRRDHNEAVRLGDKPK
jgi:tetratricopeptide (TPR) repeat protein